MPLQNRVTPFGEVVRAPWRGAFTGNRGCIHDADGQLGVSRWRHQNWVCCLTAFRGRKRDPMPPNRWTALFFWDEAVALTAGHRPCGECRNRDYKRFMAAWAGAGLPGAGPRGVDKHLHRARVTPRREQVRFSADPRDLPDGTFVAIAPRSEQPLLIWQGALWHLNLAQGRYERSGPIPAEATVLTPRPMVGILQSGYSVEPRFNPAE